MSAALIKFEVQIPVGSNQTAVNSFLSSMESLSTVYQYQTWSYDTNQNYSQFTSVYGLITSSQGPTALGYLNTLNSALGITVPCISYNVTSEP